MFYIHQDTFAQKYHERKCIFLLESNDFKLGVSMFKTSQITVNLEIYSIFAMFEHRKTQLNTVLHLIATLLM